MNKRRSALIAVIPLLLLGLASCGNPDAADVGAGSGGSDADTTMDQCVIPGWDGEGSPPPPATPSAECEDTVVHDPEEPVSNEPEDPIADVPHPKPSPVHPKPGQENVHPIGWDKSRVAKDGESVDIIFWSGVEPCYVLDRVEVDYGADKVVITLFQGSTPMEEEVACIDIALQKVTTVELEEPLGDRKVVDGTS